MTLSERMGRWAHDRMADQITDAVRTALDHGVEVKEFVACVQEAWDLELHDRRKRDNEAFNNILATPTK